MLAISLHHNLFTRLQTKILTFQHSKSAPLPWACKVRTSSIQLNSSLLLASHLTYDKISLQLRTKSFKAEMESVTGGNLVGCRLDCRLITFVRLRRSLLFQGPSALGFWLHQQTVSPIWAKSLYLLPTTFSLATWSSGTFPVNLISILKFNACIFVAFCTQMLSLLT